MTHDQLAEAAEQIDDVITDCLAKELDWITGAGGTPEEIDRYMTWRREVWAAWRCTELTKLDQWLQRDGQTTH